MTRIPQALAVLGEHRTEEQLIYLVLRLLAEAVAGMTLVHRSKIVLTPHRYVNRTCRLRRKV
jgi:hypothetical protein